MPAIPGVGSSRSVTESEILWGADHARNATLFKDVVLSGAARDAGNSPTAVLRPGLLMGIVSASGEQEEWDADASDGTQNLAGVLDIESRQTDVDSNNEDQFYRMLVARAPIKARKLLIQGSAFLGHVDEYLARRQLAAAGFVLDDDPFGYKAGRGDRQATVTGTTDVLTAAENGTRLFYNNAASVTVTLPTIQPGLVYELVRVADEEFIVTSAAGDDVIVGNDAEADSVTFTTASQHIGAIVRVESVYVGTTLKWLMTLPPAPFGTGTATMAYAIGTA